MAYLESVPSLRELATRLSLIQRWNGRTTTPWSVLQHTILAAGLLPHCCGKLDLGLRLSVLLHDTAEGYTGDIPRPFKCPEQADLEKDILAEIYEGLGLVYTLHPELRYYDDVAALVEAQCLVHPRERRHVSACHHEVHQPDTTLVEKGEDLLWDLLDGPRVEAIQWWIRNVEQTTRKLTDIPEEERV